MVMVAPALAVRHERYSPTVRRQVRGREIPVPKPMADRVHQVAEQHNTQPNAHAPDHKRPPSYQEKQNRQHNRRPDIEAVQEPVERDSKQIRRITRLEFLYRLFGGYPEHVTPPEVLASAVRVAGLVRILVVLAMLGHPIDGLAFEAKRIQQGQRIFQ